MKILAPTSICRSSLIKSTPLTLLLLASLATAQNPPTAPAPQAAQASSGLRNPATIEEAAQMLAQKIVRMIAPGPIALRFENSALLNPAVQENFKRELTVQLRAVGTRVVTRQADAY